VVVGTVAEVSPYEGGKHLCRRKRPLEEKEMGKAEGHIPMDQKQYDELFGIDNGNINESKLKEALERAWKTRNFEIDKFWVRVAYFWGFIALIFVGYITVITAENDIAIGMHLDLYLVLLGLIFSVAWLLVILGSKRWQKNWEMHIARLEDSITGPLYKTIYCTRKPYYSVSSINKILAGAVIVVWAILFLDCIVRKIVDFFRIIRYNFDPSFNIFFKYLFALVSIVVAIIFIKCLLTKGQSGNGNYKTRQENNEKEGFIDIRKEI
jgi:hypothetical protein